MMTIEQRKIAANALPHAIDAQTSTQHARVIAMKHNDKGALARLEKTFAEQCECIEILMQLCAIEDEVTP